MTVTPKERKAWSEAKAEQQRCKRCDRWEMQGLARFCPECDAEILERYFLKMNGATTKSQKSD